MFICGVVASSVIGPAGGVSYAFFVASGQGAGSAAVGAMRVVPLVAVSGASPATPLLPGSTGEAILELRNPNPFPVWLVEVRQSGPVVVSGGVGCSSVNAGIGLVTQAGLHVAVATGNHPVLVRLAGAVTMAADAATGCQGASFSIPVTATVQS